MKFPNNARAINSWMSPVFSQWEGLHILSTLSMRAIVDSHESQ